MATCQKYFINLKISKIIKIQKGVKKKNRRGRQSHGQCFKMSKKHLRYHFLANFSLYLRFPSNIKHSIASVIKTQAIETIQTLFQPCFKMLLFHRIFGFATR